MEDSMDNKTQKPTADQVAQVARLAARLVLENGGETYRAEDVALHIAAAFDLEADIIAFPTGLTMTVTGESSSSSMIARVRGTTVDLMKLEQINSVSRKISCHEMSLEEGRKELLRIRDQAPLSAGKTVVYAGVSAAMFAVMFGGALFDSIATGVCGAVIQLVLNHTPDHQAGMPVSSLISGFLAGLLALLFVGIFNQSNLDLIIVSTMMPFLPGLALTNAIRDSMRGDLLSGGARLGQALTRAIVLASGVGAALGLRIALGGVI